MLVDRRVYSSYSHYAMGRGRRHWVVSRGLCRILMSSSLLNCKILADLMAEYLSGRVRVVLLGRAPLPFPVALPPLQRVATAHLVLVRRECLETLWLISIPFWLVTL